MAGWLRIVVGTVILVVVIVAVSQTLGGGR